VNGLSEEKKFFDAMKKDEQQATIELGNLLKVRDEPFKVKVTFGGKEAATIEARRLRDPEIAQYFAELGKINPDLLTAEVATDVQMTLEKTQQMYRLMDRYIALATGLPAEGLTKVGSPRIRSALLRGIMQESTVSKEEQEAIQKFRDNP
jgi:hypothetical protein